MTKNYVAENEKILRQWEESNKKNHGEHNFAPDGIMFRGDFGEYEYGKKRLESLNGEENNNWAKAPLRILFFTKDQNAGGDDAWDVRSETGKMNYTFFRNLMYQLYGLVNTRPDYKPDYTFSNEEAIELYNTFPIARVNAKKEAGESSIDNSTLRSYLEREPDKDLLRRQIENLDADIIVCCGFSESLEGSGNLLLNFLNNNCGYRFVQQHSEEGNWMWYDEGRNKLAINNWHLSWRGCGSETIYNGMTQAYHTFLQEHPQFIESHRK